MDTGHTNQQDKVDVAKPHAFCVKAASFRSQIVREMFVVFKIQKQLSELQNTSCQTLQILKTRIQILKAMGHTDFGSGFITHSWSDFLRCLITRS